MKIISDYIYYRFKEEGYNPRNDPHVFVKTLYMIIATVAKKYDRRTNNNIILLNKTRKELNDIFSQILEDKVKYMELYC